MTVGRPRTQYNDTMLTRIREIILTYGYGARRIKYMLESEGFANVPIYITLHWQVKRMEQQLISEGYQRVQLNRLRTQWVKSS